jgi:hypothetical protein
MSVLLKSEVKFQGHKQRSKRSEHKIKSLITRRHVSSSKREELQPLNQSYLMDLKATYQLICLNANILLTYKIVSIEIFSDFGSNIQNTFSMSNIDLLHKTPVLGIVSQVQTQTQWERIYEQ